MTQRIKLLVMLLVLLGYGELNASPNIWREVETLGRDSETATHLYEADDFTLRDTLGRAPHESLGDLSHTIRLPMPDGSMALYAVVESPIMHPELALRYPTIKTYRVYGLDDPMASGRVDISPRGFHGMLHTTMGRVFIDPDGASASTIRYQMRQRRDNSGTPFTCNVDELDPRNSPIPKPRGRLAQRIPGMLLEYRLAVSATAEYVSAVGGTVPLAQSEIVTAVNRVNQIFERDLGIKLTLVPGNDQLIENGSNVSFSNNDSFALLSENQVWIDSEIGSANYDIGHVFGTGGGGLAFLGSVCNGANKARGVSGLTNPLGDPFYVDYVSHEIGHQFNADHTFNATTLGCGGGNRSALTAFEPGSGSTIMAYAGICGVEDLQLGSDAIFHSGNIEQINIFSGNDGNCGVLIPTSPISNADPVIDPIVDHSIPIQTPFELNGNAIDAESGSMLSYQWDQMDVGSSTNAVIFGSDLGDNPLFRSYLPQATAHRDFPALGTQVLGLYDDAEVVPCSGRSLNFRLTARDGNSGQDIEDVSVSVDASAGPFRITNFDIPQTVTVSDNIAVLTWDVANTNNAPVNCASVDIELITFSNRVYSQHAIHTLIAGTPNDGSQLIDFPQSDLSHPRARFRVKCSDNIFYDISDSDLLVVGNDQSPTLYSDSENTTFFNNNGTVGTVPPACSLPGVVQFPINTYSGLENSGLVTITVNRAGGSDGPISVQYSTFNGTAAAGVDYTATNGTLNFADGVTSQSFNISLLDDGLLEQEETVNIVLSNAVGATIGSQNSAVLTIIDNEVAQPGILQFSSSSYSEMENSGSVIITINRIGGSDGATSVQYATSSGTATADFDYTTTSGTLNFADGVTLMTISIPMIDDFSNEGNETFLVSLSNATGATLGSPSSASVTIIDDEPQNDSANENSSGSGNGSSVTPVFLLILFITRMWLYHFRRVKPD